MSTISSNNKRIAQNTLLLYFRMLLIMAVSLYTSRVILSALGIEDFGIYNVVGGVVALFSFLNSSMSTSTQRFLTFELGQGNLKQLKKVFAASLNIHLGICLFLVVLSETIGLWFLNTQMNIPEGRMLAANWVFQMSILSFCLSIVQTPFTASIIAHEKMSVFAYISVMEVFFKLAIAYLVTSVTFDRLIFYAILVFVVHLLINLSYQCYCFRNYVECRYRLEWNKSLYKQLTSFAGWNLFGSIAWLLKKQGINILLNIFFGPIVNASCGIAMQVSHAVTGFVSNFQTALNPQITKNYAQNNISYMEGLAYKGSKYSFFLLFFISFPLLLNLEYVLHLWLEDVPTYTSLFVILIIIESLGNVLWGNTMIVSMMATGRIRNYQIIVSSVLLMIVPISYLALKWGCDVSFVFYISIMMTLIAGLTRFSFCHKYIGYSYRRMFHEILRPVIGVLSLSVPLLLAVHKYYFDSQNFMHFSISVLVAIIVEFCAIWIVGLDKKEKNVVSQIIKNKIHK